MCKLRFGPEIVRFLEHQAGDMSDLRRVALYVFDRTDASALTEVLETFRDREPDVTNGGLVTRPEAGGAS
jgi:hypothetical protein